MRKPPFDKVELRQAVGWALDREASSRIPRRHRQRGQQQPVHRQALGATSRRRGRTYGYDPDKVAQLLEKAGYPRSSPGLDFTLLVPNGYPEFKQISTMHPGDLRLARLPAVQIEEVEIAQWSDRLNQSREFDIAVDYPPRGTADPALTYSAGNCSRRRPPTSADLNPRCCRVHRRAQGGRHDDRPGEAEGGVYDQVQMLWDQFLAGVGLRAPLGGPRRPARRRGFVPHPAFQQDWRPSGETLAAVTPLPRSSGCSSVTPDAARHLDPGLRGHLPDPGRSGPDHGRDRGHARGGGRAPPPLGPRSAGLRALRHLARQHASRATSATRTSAADRSFSSSATPCRSPSS